jgi:hypothetical protein
MIDLDYSFFIQLINFVLILILFVTWSRPSGRS